MEEKFRRKDLFLELDGVSFRRQNGVGFDTLNWQIKNNENWAIVGPSGAGKTLIIQAILGNVFITKGAIHYHFYQGSNEKHKAQQLISHVSFSEQSHLFNYSNFYYQQRFNSTESEEGITVQEYLGVENLSSEIITNFNISELLDTRFLKLSNGQTRKVRIAKALLSNPRLLVLDEPFIGLDEEFRKSFLTLIDKLDTSKTKIILITSTRQLPDCITNILELEDFKIKELWTKEAFAEHSKSFRKRNIEMGNDKFNVPKRANHPDFAIAAKFTDVSIAYVQTSILKKINWTVRRGEKWALLGPNGAGKTTLLSLINADNPQAYSQNIILFDRARGSGESIWEIKKKIGFLSPEQHYYYQTNMTCREVVATGFMETMFISKSLTKEEEISVNESFMFFNKEEFKEKPFFSLSTGEQKLLLFVRALIKNPPLLILDEPFQGMDPKIISLCKEYLKTYLTDSTTLIFVTHQVEEIPEEVDKIYYLRNGIGEIKSKSSI